jgi:hypothetical protein
MRYLLAQSHPDRRGYRGAGVSDCEQVILAFGRIGETADTLGPAKILKFVFAARDDLVRIALMADVPEQLVVLEIEDGSLSCWKSKTQCRASVSSTAPRLLARCPPVLLTEPSMN